MVPEAEVGRASVVGSGVPLPAPFWVGVGVRVPLVEPAGVGVVLFPPVPGLGVAVTLVTVPLVGVGVGVPSAPVEGLAVVIVGEGVSDGIVVGVGVAVWLIPSVMVVVAVMVVVTVIGVVLAGICCAGMFPNWSGFGSIMRRASKYQRVPRAGSFPHPRGPSYKRQMPSATMGAPSGASRTISLMPMMSIWNPSEMRPQRGCGPL